jgi:hypothetical protein
MKIVRAVIAAALTLAAAGVIQMATSSGASATDIKHPTCTDCWEISPNH